MIGIFDSGIGGLGVTSILRKKAPNADLIYFGDLANMPYGPRPTPELFTLTIRALAFLSTQEAIQYISACNSVSVSVIQSLIDQMTKPNTQIIEMVGPTVRAVRKNHTDP